MRVVWLFLYVFVAAVADETPKVAKSAVADGRPVVESGDSQAAASEDSHWVSPADSSSAAAESRPQEGSLPPTNDDHPWTPSEGPGAAPEPRGNAHHPTENRKDVHKVTITKKVRVPYTLHVEKRIPKIIEVPVDKPFNVYVPKPYPVIVEKKVPYEIKVPQPQPYTVEKRVPYPVKVLVDKPYTLHVPKPYPVEVDKNYEFTVEKKIPYEVKVPVERPYPVHVITEKEVRFPVETKVPVPVKVPYEKPIPVHVAKHFPVHVDKPVPYTVEKVATYPVKVPFRIPIKVHYPEGGSTEESYRNVQHLQAGQNAQNFEWAEAMNSAIRSTRLVTKQREQPSQQQGEQQRQLQWQGEQQRQLQSQAENQQPSQFQGKQQQQQPFHSQAVSHQQSQSQGEWQQRPSQLQLQGVFQQRPSQLQGDWLKRPTHVRQGFSTGRGHSIRNGYLLSLNSLKRPTTKLQPVKTQYEVKEAQFEQYSTSPFLGRPGSEVVVPQMVLSATPPSFNGGLQQSESSVGGRFQANSPSADSNVVQHGSSPFGFSNPVQFSEFRSPTPPTARGHHNYSDTGSPSFTITNVVNHAGAPAHQQPTYHRTPFALPSRPPVQWQYLSPNPQSTESAELPSTTYFQPSENSSSSVFGSKTPRNPSPPAPQSPFVISGYTISGSKEPNGSPPRAQIAPQSPFGISGYTISGSKTPSTSPLRVQNTLQSSFDASNYIISGSKTAENSPPSGQNAPQFPFGVSGYRLSGSKTTEDSPQPNQNTLQSPFSASGYTLRGSKTTDNSPTSVQNAPQSPFGASGYRLRGSKATENAPTSDQNAPQSSFGASDFTISFHKPQTSPQLFKPAVVHQPVQNAQNDGHVANSYVGTKTIREGQELSYSTSVHHIHDNSPLTRPELLKSPGA